MTSKKQRGVGGKNGGYREEKFAISMDRLKKQASYDKGREMEDSTVVLVDSLDYRYRRNSLA